MNKIVQTRHFAVLVWALGLFALMSLGLTPNFPSLPMGGDKILHVSAFLTLMIGPVLFLPRPWMIMTAAFFLIFCGALLEILQEFVPGRESSAADLCADIIGVGIALLLGYFLHKTQIFDFLPVKERPFR